LRGETVENRKKITGNARRELVWALERLAWRSSSFHDAVKSLAFLAEAENETWGNNATGEFIERFQIFLGGTALPYLDRLPVLDDLLLENRQALSSLVVRALAQIGNQQDTRIGGSPDTDEVPEAEWHPENGQVARECLNAGVNRLIQIAKQGMPGIQSDLLYAATHFSMLLRVPTVRQLVADYFDAIRQAYPETREALRRIISDLIDRETKYWKDLSSTEIEELKGFHHRFEDHSLSARLMQYVGHEAWDEEEKPDLKPLAKELLSPPNLLVQHWQWLTSGEASNAWRLGEALAEIDDKGELDRIFLSLSVTDPDLRLLCAYICARRRVLGDKWYEDWVLSQAVRSPKPVTLLFDLAWRCGATDTVANTLSSVLDTEPVNPGVVGRLGFGQWAETVSFEVMERLLSTMAKTGHSKTVIAILAHQLKSPIDIERWRNLALQLVQSSELIRSEDMISHYWSKVAQKLVGNYSKEIASAVLREQANRGAGFWFSEHSNAAKVLKECVETNPGSVWEAIRPYLSSKDTAPMFTIGFPKGLLEKMPVEDIESWIAENPDDHASIIARITNKDFSTDETLASRIIGKYGENDHVAGAFFSAFVSGSWYGPASAHWDVLADSLEKVAGQTRLPNLRRWATNSVQSLRRMAERDRQREEEEELRRR
jgi:hypothetical protein